MINLVRNPAVSHLFALSRFELADMLQAMLEVADMGHAVVDVTLATDGEVADLNRSFLQCTGPTNVLSFETTGAERDKYGPQTPYLGQIVLSVPMLRRECMLYEQDLITHGCRLLAHGMMHLAGQEHGPLMEELTEAAVDAALLARTT